MRKKFMLERRHLDRVRASVDMNIKYTDMLPRNRTRKERLAATAQAKADYDEHQKRIKFRGLAMKFLEWRACKDDPGI